MASLKNLAKLINEKTKQKTPEQEFLYMLEQTISRLDNENKRKPSQSFKPSSLGGCLRKVFYQVEGVEEEGDIRSADSVGITESGTDRHERIQKAVAEMNRMGYPCEWIDVEEYLIKRPQTGTRVVERKGMEVKLFNDVLNLSFLCDGIILMRGIYYVLEIKTEVEFKFQGRTQAEDNHITQACCYSATLGIDRVMYLYENRNLCQKKTIVYIVSDEDKFNRVIAPIETVNAHREAGTIPPKTDKKKFCNYCDYKTQCRRDG
jgi:CRISPR/Cas system-associated exonuclease Cas4 (RecB family)